MPNDNYAIIKGKALTMVREYVKLYPDYDRSDLNARIVHEVITAARYQFKENDYRRQKTQEICFEIRKAITGE